MPQPNLKQIAAIFNDCIEEIRNQKHENLEQQAVEYLKAARYQVMRSIEQEYYTLVASRENPSSQQGWAVSSKSYLFINVPRHPAILDPYENAIAENLRELMKDCGFQATVYSQRAGYGAPSICINFPDRLTGSSTGRPQRPLRIKDEFSNGSALKKFQKLLTNKEGDEDEEDEEDGGGEGSSGPSRASSMTFDSRASAPRRSSRLGGGVREGSSGPSRASSTTLDSRASTPRRSSRLGGGGRGRAKGKGRGGVQKRGR